MIDDGTATYAPSATGLAFHQDRTSEFKLVLGPVGGGKTSMATMDVFFASLNQAPDWAGRRRTRWLFMRSTYPELKSTVIKTFEYWLGGMCTVVYDTPIRAKIEYALADGTILDVEFLFIALEGDEDIGKLRSLEVTGAMVSEMSQTSWGIIEMLQSRVGRYPAVDHNRGFAGATWSGIIAESNPPHIRHWIYQKFVLTPVPGWKLYRQPPALIYNAQTQEYDPNPDADNIKNLSAGYDYYYKLVKGASEEYVKVYVLGEWGITFDGRPVYRNFSQSTHCLPAAPRIMGHLPIIAGVDFGLTPAVAFTQLQGGTLVALSEIAPTDVTLEELIRDYIQTHVQQRYLGLSVLFVGDPSGGARSALAAQNSFQVLRSNGLAAVPCATNEIDIRIGAVDYFLQRRDGLAVSPECPDLITGLGGAYRFKKRNANDLTSDWKDKPEKNFASHLQDALQMAAVYHRMAGTDGYTKKPKLAPREKFRYA